jgi:hypothetical protein
MGFKTASVHSGSYLGSSRVYAPETLLLARCVHVDLLANPF